MSRARAATLALAMVVGASAAGVMKTCRDMNASAAPLVPPPLPAAASSLQFHEVERLRKANETLERNISVLFNTALAEIGRKDREIERLQRSAGR